MSGLQRASGGDGIAVLRLDRPQRRNALDTATLGALIAALGEVAADEAVRVLVLSTTSERALCAGADVAEELDHAGGAARMDRFAAMYQALTGLPQPTVAVMVGDVVGAGAEIAAACDLRVAGDPLKLAWAGARLGVPVGPARLTPLIGLARAKELVYTGRVVGAEEAHAIGLAERLAPAGGAEAAALELAAEIARHPADGLRRLKALFGDLDGLPARTARENAVLTGWQRTGAGLPHGGLRPRR